MIGLRSGHNLSTDMCAFLPRVLTPYPSDHAPESSNYMTCTSFYSSLPLVIFSHIFWLISQNKTDKTDIRTAINHNKFY